MNYSARIHLVKQKQKLSKKPIIFTDNVALNYVENFSRTISLTGKVLAMWQIQLIVATLLPQ